MGKTGLIYKATNKINGKVYIGQTIQSIEKRIQGHLYAFKNKIKTKLYQAIEKHGWDNFKWEVIKTNISINLLNEEEIYYIKEYNSINSGYNILKGGSHNATQYSVWIKKYGTEEANKLLNLSKEERPAREWILQRIIDEDKVTGKQTKQKLEVKDSRIRKDTTIRDLRRSFSSSKFIDDTIKDLLKTKQSRPTLIEWEDLED